MFVTTFVELWHIMVRKKQSAPVYLIRNAHLVTQMHEEHEQQAQLDHLLVRTVLTALTLLRALT